MAPGLERASTDERPGWTAASNLCGAIGDSLGAGQEAEQTAGGDHNWANSKRVLTDTGKLEPAILRERLGRFEPALIAKYQPRFPVFEQKKIALYARDIQAHLREPYDIEISPELVSTVTDAMLDEVSAWPARPLEPVYAIVSFDCLYIKIRDYAAVKNKAVYLAIGVRCCGHKEALGICIK